MKNRFLTAVLLILLLSPLAAGAVQKIRAKPVLKADKEYNAILLHVAQYFVLTIPDGKTIRDINSAIRCTFVIAPNGALQQLEIENDVDSWTGLFEGAEAKRTETWLRNAVLDGMHRVPPFNMNEIRSSKSAKKRTVVFSFGRTGSSTDIPSMGFNSGMVDANLNQALQQQLQDIRDGKEIGDRPKFGMTNAEADRRYLRQGKAWAGFTDENIKSTMKPRFETNQSPLPVIKTQPKLPAPNDTIPKIEVAVSLQ